MCGILGFITDRPTIDNYQLLGDLLYVSSSRGTDATGVAVVNNRKIKVVKEDIGSDKFIKKHYGGLKDDVARSRVVLGHTRLATQGHQRDNNNNHPITSERYVMVHNGTCPSMDRIKGYPYKGEVDSEILLSYVERKGLKDGLKELKGSAAVAIVDSEDLNAIYLWRHNNPLWVAYDPTKKTIFFGSTEDILREGLSNLLNFFSSFQMRQIQEDYLYKITCNPLNIEMLGEIEPKGWGYTYHRKGSTTPYCNNGWDSDYDESMYCRGASSVDVTPLNSDSPVDPTFANYFRQLSKCNWDGKNKIYTTDSIAPVDKITKYYFKGQSHDFKHWGKFEGGGHLSIDKKLLKFYDKEKKCHFLITVTDAIREGLVDLSR